MKPEDKRLLLMDLCARLPYGLKYNFGEYDGCDYTMGRVSLTAVDDAFPIENVKPYLFPLSSITKEQEKELLKLGVSYGEYALHDDIRGLGIMVEDAYIFFEFCYKHHIDFLGLIPKGLAIDATHLNIY